MKRREEENCCGGFFCLFDNFAAVKESFLPRGIAMQLGIWYNTQCQGYTIERNRNED